MIFNEGDIIFKEGFLIVRGRTDFIGFLVLNVLRRPFCTLTLG